MAQGAQSVSSSSKPWYKKWWGILILILFWPISLSVFLINYIWKKTNWSQGAKIGATAGVIIVIGFILIAFSGSPTPEPTSTTVSDTNQGTQEAAKPLVEQKPEPVLSEEEQMKQLVVKDLGDRLRTFKATQKNDSWVVEIEFNGSDNLSTKMIRQGIESDMSVAYMALFKSAFDIDTVKVSAFFPLVDKYGNNAQQLVYASSLEKSEASKINWETNISTLKLRVIPGIWDTIFVHPAIIGN